MEDKLIYENILLILKSNMEVYTHGTLESSNPCIRESIQYGLFETLKMQNELYNKMKELGWYQVENIDSNKILKTFKKVSKK